MMNIFFVGDELVGGKGDPKALGWTGRVAARTVTEENNLMFHTLSVPGESTGEMALRWDEEVMRRVGRGSSNAVVFGIGRNDVRRGVSLAMTRFNLANALDRTRALGFRTMVVGPPPSLPHENGPIAELAGLVEEAAVRREARYVDTYGPLAAHEQWLTDMAMGDDGVPGPAGYGLIAWLVLHAQWRDWLGLPSDT
jgi:lysophospholipase L1-like esterase